MQKTKFYDTAWFMWLTLIFFTPVGIFLLWKNKKLPKPVKIALSVFFGLVFLFALIPTDDSTEKTMSNKDNVAIEEQSNDNNENLKENDKKSQEELEKQREEEEKQAEENRIKEQLTITGTIELEVKDDNIIMTINSNVADGGIFEISIVNTNLEVESYFVPIKDGKIVQEFVKPSSWGVGTIMGMANFSFNIEDIIQPEHIKEMYGEYGEKILGSLTYDTSNVEGKMVSLTSKNIDYPNKQAVQEVKDKETKHAQWVTSQFSAWDGSNKQLKDYVKKSMNDEESFKHIETTYINLSNQEQVDKVNEILNTLGVTAEIGDLYVCMEFSGKNAFNATIKQKAYALFVYKSNTFTFLGFE